MRMPDWTKTCFTPGCVREPLSRSRPAFSLISNTGQIDGHRQLGRWHFLHSSAWPLRAPYKLAVGPPKSDTVPRKVGEADSLRISLSTESMLRLERNLPWWKPSPQNVQPPGHPRDTMMESLMVAKPGTGSV